MINDRFQSSFKTLQFKVSMTYISMVIVVLIFLNYYPMIVARDFIVAGKREEMLASANALAEIMTENFSVYTQYEPGFFESVVNRGYDRVLITDKNARVIYDSDESYNLIGKTVLVPDIYGAINREEIFRAILDESKYEFSAAVPIIFGDQVDGAVYIYRISRQEVQMLMSVQRYILIFSIMLSIVIMALSLFFSRVLTEQIRYIRSGIAVMKEGRYNEKIPVKSDDELGRLAETFNEFSQKLELTEQKRREFVSDASHELKTPLASIKLLADSILQSENMDLETIKDFMGDIESEIDRLVRITERLFVLTRTDEDERLSKVDIDTDLVVIGAIRVIAPIALQRNINIESEIQDGIIISGTPDSFSQIVYNLLDNAVKYNRDGGTINVSLSRIDDHMKLAVRDSGLGISPEDIPKIFERFYRVDKARSRDTGGTGLGLPIVSSTLKNMGGEIEVQSVEGEGTVFTVTLPAAQKSPPKN